MSKIQILKAAKALIADPANWTQGVSARGKSGRQVNVDGRAAVCFCSIGAIKRVCIDSGNFDNYYETVRFVNKIEGGDGFVVFNDNHTHSEVMALWDRAIAAAEVAVI